MSGLRILILAAGYSRRLGRPKALVRIRGQSLLRRIARVLGPLSDRALIIVTPPRCTRYRHELRGHAVRLVANPGRASGLSGSVRRGLAHTRWSAATLIVPGDLAALERADVERLLKRWHAAPRRIAARRIGERGGAPLILPRRCYPLVRDITGDTGLREWLMTVPASDRVLADMPSAERDIDTPRDLELARRSPRR
ncbi:MAG: NTP transferase domain-containing protein [Steroidobacterales bacterium]